MEDKKTIRDKYGQEMTIVDNKTVMLQLTGQEKPKKIGVINLVKKYFYVKRRKKDIYFNYAYAFNVRILQEDMDFNRVVIHDENGIYNIPVSTILKKGVLSHLSEDGLGSQILLSIRIIKKHEQ